MYNCLCHSVHFSKLLRRVKIWSMHPCHFQKPACSCLRHRSIALEICLMMSLVEAVLSWDFSIFEGSDSCHDFFFLFTSASIFLVVVCSEIRWNTVPILLPALLPWRVAFPVYLQLVCQCHRSADELGDLVHLSLFSPVGGFLCLTGRAFHVVPLFCLCHSSSLSGLRLDTAACISLSVSNLVSMTFFFRAFPLAMAWQVPAVIQSFLFFCLRPRQASLVCV